MFWRQQKLQPRTHSDQTFESFALECGTAVEIQVLQTQLCIFSAILPCSAVVDAQPRNSLRVSVGVVAVALLIFKVGKTSTSLTQATNKKIYSNYLGAILRLTINNLLFLGCRLFKPFPLA